MARWTLSYVCGLSRSLSFIAREIVEMETPAFFATSTMLGGFFIFFAMRADYIIPIAPS